MSQREERRENGLSLSSIREDSTILNDQSIVTNDRDITQKTSNTSGYDYPQPFITPRLNLNSNEETKRDSFIKRWYGNTRHSTSGSLSDVTTNERKTKIDPLNRSEYNNRHPAFSFVSDVTSSGRSTKRDSHNRNGYNNRHSSVSFEGDVANPTKTYSAMKKRISSRNLSVSFDFPDPRKSKTKLDFSIENVHDSIDNGSEQFFLEPERPHARSIDSDSGSGSEESFLGPERTQSRRNNFVNSKKRQNAESLAVEVEELGFYLATLKKRSIIDTKTSVSVSDATLINSNRGNHDSNGIYGGNDPKSRRRFSMAFRTTDEVVTFPDDCFSFLIIHGPIESPWFFFFGLCVSLLQLCFLILAAYAQVTQTSDNPNTPFAFIPSNVDFNLRYAQILSVLSYCLFAETSLKDFITAVELWPQYSKVTEDDKYGCMVFSCVLRATMALLTAFVTLLLLMTSDDVIDTILDFLAMTFISDIGKMAFQLALWGKYGPQLEAEARRLEDEPMPKCMLRDYSNKRYLVTVLPIVLLILTTMLGIIVAQATDTLWRTSTIRVQFINNADLEPYSGCYNAIGNSNRRSLYEGFPDNSAKFGYCIGNKQWFLFNNEDDDPCDITSEERLAQSSSTFTYDISASFSGTWSDTHGTPTDLYFFAGITEEDLADTCESFMNNGHCHPYFNNFDYGYDGGDCCASTCTKSNCGAGLLKSAFGRDVIYGDGFPQCKDPAMVPITIKLQDIFNSYTYEGYSGDNTSNSTSLSTLRVEDSSIIEPVMLLDCDDRNILTVNINENMIDQMETVMVEDGANCTIRINNSTSSTKGGEKPIWYVNYTVYHGNKTTVEEDPIVILQEQSVNNEYANFERIPECYFAKLSNHLDNSTIYMGTGPQNRAIKWLRLTSRTGRNSLCEDDYFIERYALSVLNFAAPIQPPPTSQDDPNTEANEDDSPASIDLSTDSTSLSNTSTPEIYQVQRISYGKLWIEETRQCIWRSVECNGPSVKSLDLQKFDLSGSIATSIGLLTTLTKLDVGKYVCSCSPNVIRLIDRSVTLLRDSDETVSRYYFSSNIHHVYTPLNHDCLFFQFCSCRKQFSEQSFDRSHS
jgi:hypothetical protein